MFASRFKETFTLNRALPEEKDLGLRELLERRLGSLSARDHQEMTYVRDLSCHSF